MKKVSNRPANDDNEPVDVELPGFSLDDFFEFEQVTMDCDTVEAVIPNTAVEEHKFDFKLFNGVVKNVGLMDAVEKSQERIQKIEFDSDEEQENLIKFKQIVVDLQQIQKEAEAYSTVPFQNRILAIKQNSTTIVNRNYHLSNQISKSFPKRASKRLRSLKRTKDFKFNRKSIPGKKQSKLSDKEKAAARNKLRRDKKKLLKQST